MTDKYEEFKKWLMKSNYRFWIVNVDDSTIHSKQVISTYEVFKEFEEEQQENEREKEIKETISNIVMRTPITDNIIDKIYDELKERDLIK